MWINHETLHRYYEIFKSKSVKNQTNSSTALITCVCSSTCVSVRKLRREPSNWKIMTQKRKVLPENLHLKSSLMLLFSMFGMFLAMDKVGRQTATRCSGFLFNRQLVPAPIYRCSWNLIYLSFSKFPFSTRSTDFQIVLLSTRAKLHRKLEISFSYYRGCLCHYCHHHQNSTAMRKIDENAWS